MEQKSRSKGMTLRKLVEETTPKGCYNNYIRETCFCAKRVCWRSPKSWTLFNASSFIIRKKMGWKNDDKCSAHFCAKSNGGQKGYFRHGPAFAPLIPRRLLDWPLKKGWHKVEYKSVFSLLVVNASHLLRSLPKSGHFRLLVGALVAQQCLWRRVHRTSFQFSSGPLLERTPLLDLVLLHSSLNKRKFMSRESIRLFLYFLNLLIIV